MGRLYLDWEEILVGGNSISNDRFQKVGVFPSGCSLWCGVVGGADWGRSWDSPAQLSVLVFEVPKMSGRGKLVLAHTAFSKLSMIEKGIYVPVISGEISWGRLHSFPGSGISLSIWLTKALTFSRQLMGWYILWIEVIFGWATLLWIPVGSLKELLGQVLCYLGLQGVRALLELVELAMGGQDMGVICAAYVLWERVA